MLLGVLGLAAGAVGSKHIIFVCEQCGYRWKADPANLAVNAPPGTPLEIGDVLQGRVVEIIPFAFNPEAQARIDLGEGRYGTLYDFANVNRKRKRRGKEPISLGDEITVRVRHKQQKGPLGYRFGYAVVLAED